MIVANGATDVTTYWVLRDSTLHAPKTDVTVTDIDLYYVEQGAAISAKADATALAAADSAHADNKAFHVGQGLYRIDWPDAAFDGGVGKHVILIVVCSGVDTTFLEVELSPAVNTIAVGGTTQTARDLGASVLLSSGTGTGQISLSSGAVTAGTVSDKTGYGLTSAYDAAKTAASQTSVDTLAGYVDTEVAAIKAKTDNLPASPAAVGSAMTLTAAYDAAKTAAQAGDAMTLAAGSVTAAAIATGAIDADALAADAVAEIADGVWDEALAGHAAAGSAGAGLTAASSAGDPWATALPGAYSAGTAGKIVGDRLDAAVSTRAVAGDAMTLAAGAVSAAAIATGAIDADAIAADAVTELQAGLATSADIAALNDVTGDEVADALLARDLGSGTAAGTLNERTVRSALRVLRNKWAVSAGVLTVTKEDDVEAAWTAAVTSATGAAPVTTVDPT
jgi:hypothetical protein